MKYLLLLAVIGLALWLLKARRRDADSPPSSRRGRSAPKPTPMIACAHCGVHLPQSEAVSDAQGRPYCGAAHLAAGPR